MKESINFEIGDIVKTRKPHACGTDTWEVIRIGIDFKLKCEGCGHVITMPREKALRAITKKITI